jgi:glutathione S-transferase
VRLGVADVDDEKHVRADATRLLPMSVTITVVNGSHPCVTVELALARKGIPYKTVELPPPFHAVVQRVRTGKRTVPSMKLDGEKISGSRAILRRLDAYVPTPPLYGTTDAERMTIEDAEEWGDEVLQPLVRRVLWPTLARSPESLASFSEGSKLPPIPGPVLKTLAPVVTRVEFKLNDASQDRLAEDVRALPALLDRVDALLAEGTLGTADAPNAAGLQIAPSITLLLTIADLAPLFAGRPCADWARGVVGHQIGTVPEGAIADLVTAAQS